MCIYKYKRVLTPAKRQRGNLSTRGVVSGAAGAVGLAAAAKRAPKGRAGAARDRYGAEENARRPGGAATAAAAAATALATTTLLRTRENGTHIISRAVVARTQQYGPSVRFVLSECVRVCAFACVYMPCVFFKARARATMRLSSTVLHHTMIIFIMSCTRRV